MATYLVRKLDYQKNEEDLFRCNKEERHKQYCSRLFLALIVQFYPAYFRQNLVQRFFFRQISFLLVVALLASFSSTSSSLPLNFFPGPFAPPHPGHPGGSHPCARDFDFSDCDPEDASFFGLQSNAEARPAGDRGFKTYENGAVVPVEGPGLAVSASFFVRFSCETVAFSKLLS